MKINLFFGFASLVLAMSSSGLIAQNYQTMPVSSGYNEDVIANGIGPSLNSTSTILDGDSFVFVARDFKLTSGSTAITYGVPTDGIINSVVASTPGLSYQLGNLSASNSLRLSNANLTGTLAFTVPKAATKLYMLSTSGSAASTLTVTVNFSDGTNQQAAGIAVPDWYGGADFAITGLGRISRITDALDAAGGTNPRMYQAAISIDAANQTKLIQSVTITKTSTTNGFPNVFAFSADAYSDCAPPVLQATTAITSTGATVAWAASASTQAASYGVYYSTSATTPTSATTTQLNNITGTSTPIAGLASNTIYYYWVKTNCSNATGQSVWSFSGTFKTACGPVTSLSENFDSYNTGTTLPDCWVRNFVNGTMSISSATPASGTRNIYQLNSTSQTPSTVVLPEFSNVNAGTHWLRLKARVSAATGTLNVGYVTNPTDTSTFVLIQALSLANTNYVTNSEYGVIVPSTVPANARLAIRNTADGKGYYWDDVNWEVIPACLPPTSVSTSAVTANTVTASWTAPSSAPANGYEYYYSTANTAPTDASTPTGSIAAGNVSSVISGFNPSTTYYLWLRSSCSTTSKSTWSYVGTFTTLCAAVLPPYTNDFSTVPGNCWSTNLSGGTPATGPTGTSGIWVSGAFLNTGTVNSMRVNLYDVNRTGWLKTNAFNLSTGVYKVEFDYGLTTYNGTGTSTMGSDDNVQFLVSNDGGSTWTSLQTWNTSNTPTNTSTTYSFNLTGYNGANTVFAFYGTDGTVNDIQDYDFHVDNFKVELTNLGTSESTGMNKKLSIHPNPFKDVIYISDSKDIKSVTVYDVAGRVVKQVNDSSKEIHLAELKEGLYMIKVSFKDGTESVTKAIKK